jgi:hypothetical protein
MIIKISRLIAISVAFAVWLAYSVPAQAALGRNSRIASSAGLVQGDDDDDEGLSGGALAVLLLAIGGAVAGVLYAARPKGGNDKIVCDRVSNEVTLRMNSTNANGKQSSSTLNAKRDDKSGTITLIRKSVNAAGKTTQSQWTGKLDGKYYSITGNATANEISYTKASDNMLEFTARKGDEITLRGRLVVLDDGQRLAISTEKIDSAGQRITKQTVYSSGPKVKRKP